ncbi:DUF1707 SHOCT-like domain-containing protein [Streptomonospora salina]|uniref:DUF1707 domain-containing protein n=1 Tax=Streptomonospora salina TaxID=104205 RepID=A0A841ED11_9ACTN|nr:DUF1707 domain-containing protein [Streptomonospora salina]MBB5998953.1 hypothetical protein [Streptomonospora salina]
MNETASAPAAGPANLKASDADRDRTAEVLAAALSEGRLSHAEHGERIDAAYAARTRGELAPLTTDLPAGAPTAPEAAAPPRSPTGSENIRAVLASAERTGHWLVEPRTNVSVILGAAVLDLREATLSQHEVTIQTALVMGSLEIIVAPGVRVVSRASDILSATGIDTDLDADSSAPTVVITGSSWLSSVEARAKPRRAGAAERKRRCR